MKNLVLYILLFFLLPLDLFSQTITVSGAPWIITIGDPLQPDPFPDVYSPDPQIEITVHGSRDGWVVTVERDEMNWDSTLDLFVQRTGSGKGPGSISGGTSWIEITTISTDFFRGTRNKNKVPCQYLLQSDWPPQGSYSTTVTYTVTNL